MTISSASNTELKSGEPWAPILARVTAAIFGGYALTYTFGAAAAKVLPLRPSEAVYLISMLQILLYVCIVIWIFSVTGTRAWVTLLALSALCITVTLFS